LRGILDDVVAKRGEHDVDADGLLKGEVRSTFVVYT
jgi:hypothetical protein